MKKIITVLAVIFSLSTGAIYAADGSNAGKTLLKSFNKEFTGASNVSWTKVSDELYRARFDYKGKDVRAFYTESDGLVAVGSVITADQLPLMVSKAIDAKYAGYDKTESIEYTMDGETQWLVTVSDGKEGAILIISGSGGLNVFKKLKY